MKDIQINRIGKDLTVMKIIGKFNIELVALYEKTFYKEIERKIKTIIIDLSGLDYLDSSAIGALIKSSNSSKNHEIEFILADLSSEIMEIFKLAFLDNFFYISTKEKIKKKFPGLDSGQ